MNKKIYYNLQLKRAFKLYPSILIITLVIITCIGICAASLMGLSGNDESKKVFNVGLVGNAEDAYLGMGISALKNIDNSRYYINLTEMTEEEAVKALEEKKIAGYAYIPDNFVRDVMNGTNTPVEYVTTENPAGFGDVLEKEVVLMVSDLVTESQKSNYSVRALAKDKGVSKGVGKKLEKLNFAYINYILNRTNTQKLIITGIKDELTYGGYYICAILVFFLMIWGISCNKLLGETHYELSRLLNIRGIGIKEQMASKFISFGAVTLVTLFILALIFGVVASNTSFGIPELMSANILTCAGFIVKILPVVIMFTAMHIMLYELFTGSVGSILAQFLTAIGLGYISGLFYPNTFFPEGVQIFAEILPSGAAFAYVRKALSGGLLLKEFLIVTVYAVIFFSASVILRKYKITGDRVI